ncbi:GNAT family N-acetyltransferase [Paenibacillus abyssi]|uniref:N-acetyltransferase domain-containing protein n=1 Tax=Paenibacillus abyssi TaxID=1340531 RepID=A0A917CYH9_9BACL|nr:GNAT family N-acetyltransferase [Paenibacillus abyssi]GGG04524.1 hypothetical protein GCM10010916_21960 [Paenibacillus abyssi]
MVIRPYRPRTDRNEIIRLIRTELIPLSHTVKPRDAKIIREIPKRLEQGVTFVASKSKSSLPLGFVQVLKKDQALLINMLAVDRQQQGRQLGSTLMRTAEAYGLSKECRHATVFVDEGNDRAMRFYARLGYGTAGYLQQLRCYEMRKQLVDPLIPV